MTATSSLLCWEAMRRLRVDGVTLQGPSVMSLTSSCKNLEFVGKESVALALIRHFGSLTALARPDAGRRQAIQ